MIARDLHDGVGRLSPLALLVHQDAQVELGVVEEGSHHILHQQYGLHVGQHVLAEVAAHVLLVLLGHVQPPLEHDLVLGQLGDDLLFENAAELLLLPVHDPLDGAHRLLRADVEFPLRFLVDPEQVTVVGHPDAEELIQVRRVYGQELQPLKQGQALVLGLL